MDNKMLNTANILKSKNINNLKHYHTCWGCLYHFEGSEEDTMHIRALSESSPHVYKKTVHRSKQYNLLGKRYTRWRIYNIWTKIYPITFAFFSLFRYERHRNLRYVASPLTLAIIIHVHAGFGGSIRVSSVKQS
eukprot:sb/3474806/